ncbi:MAG: HupE/UreJ family protein [Bryobacterales bacterium]|nr:HupE/UreJ family protein [Bryobacterales bacterium]
MSQASARQLIRDGVVGTLAGSASILCAIPATAHVLSVSQGSLRLAGQAVQYELRMPLSEVPEDENPQATLLEAFQVFSQGQAGVLADQACREEAGQGLYICEAEYRFAAPPAKISVRCDFPSVTVPHHMHILQSGEGDSARQTVFDITSRQSEIRFVPPTLGEVVATNVGAGSRKAITSPELLLFLVVLALAARSRREFFVCAGAFLCAQTAVAATAGTLGWIPPLRFLEAAAALTVAYMASEILFLPDARHRWIVCGSMGCFHGLFLAAFLAATAMKAPYFLSGAISTEGLIVTAAGAIRLRCVNGRAEQLAAILLLVGGLAWFGLRLID